MLRREVIKKLGSVIESQLLFLSSHQIGLVHELVDTPEAAMERCVRILTELGKSDREAFARTKVMLRKEGIDKFNALREEELEAFVKSVLEQRTQDALGAYLASLKKK